MKARYRKRKWTVLNVMKAAAFERTYGTESGTIPRRENPKSGFGMKQVREAQWGAKHREGEKP